MVKDEHTTQNIYWLFLVYRMRAPPSVF